MAAPGTRCNEIATDAGIPLAVHFRQIGKGRLEARGDRPWKGSETSFG
jgi:hypothetical protein